MPFSRHAIFAVLAFAAGLPSVGFAAAPKPFVTGLNRPISVCYGPKDLLYVVESGDEDKDGAGRVVVIENGRPREFAKRLDQPGGMVYFRDALYVVDNTKIVRIDNSGQLSDYMTPKDFPSPPRQLVDLAVDRGNGILLVTDEGDTYLVDRSHAGSAVYRIDVRLNKIETVADKNSKPKIGFPCGIRFDGESHALVSDPDADCLFRIRLTDHSIERVAATIEHPCGLIWDQNGRLFVGSDRTGAVYAIPRPGEKPIAIDKSLKSAAFGCLDLTGKNLIVPDAKAGTLTMIPTTIPGWEVDESPLSVELKPAFPKLQWTGWDDGSESGKSAPLRPIVLTHAGDKSNRVFVATQHGVIHSFKNSDAATKTKVFLDLTDRVRYDDKQNEEGFLGLAFHPKFASNGELFVFYTEAKTSSTNVLSRFRLKKGKTDEADPASEEQLIRFEKPHWNHDGGTIVFGPDGYLYITHGDGGGGGDPAQNGQKLSSLLGKVLRIDVDHKSAAKNYAIPADNPFVKQKDAAPEIWAYGIRNIWRMAFDRKTGQLWAGEVGQNRFEEIDIITRGGNYGWSIRESLHPFGNKGVDTRPDIIEPIWEYDHDIGVSITGGLVYRGQQIPDLDGLYLYADYVRGRLWALRYDPAKKRVVANHTINNPGLAIMSFGEDEKGEAYVLTVSPTGRGIHRLVKGSEKSGK